MYTRFCSVPEQQPEVCPNVGWVPDFRDPQVMLDVPFYGPTIDPENNSNWPQLDVPEVNKAIEEARLVEDPDERARGVGRGRRARQRAGAGRPMDLGVLSPDPVRGRGRSGEPLQRLVGPQLHVAEVEAANAAPEAS